MAGLVLDSMGTIKMKALDDAVLLIQRINALNEQMASNAKRGVASASTYQTIKRYLNQLAANLKSQFGMISDAVTNLYVQSSRGSNDATRVRTIREGLAQVKQAIEIGYTQTKLKHAVHKEKAEAAPQGE
jgi:hypothetical protein